MTSFSVIGHTATTDGSFSLNDLPGKAGRMDLISRTVQASLFLSHGIREDVTCTLILLGSPKPGVIIRFDGSAVRSMSPDERNVASFIRMALGIPAGSIFREVAPGISVRRGTLAEILAEKPHAVLDEHGTDIRKAGTDNIPSAFLLSDHQNFTPGEEALMRELPRFSLGPAVLHADHAIVLLLNEIDRRRSEWN